MNGRGKIESREVLICSSVSSLYTHSYFNDAFMYSLAIFKVAALIHLDFGRGRIKVLGRKVQSGQLRNHCSPFLNTTFNSLKGIVLSGLRQ